MTTQTPPRLDYTNKDYSSLLAAMVALARQWVPEWTDQSSNDVGMMLLQLFAYMGDTLFYDQDRIAAECFLDTAQERRSVLQMLRLIGYELKPPVPASTDLTLLFKYQTSHAPVTIAMGAQFTTASVAGGPPVGFYATSGVVISDVSRLQACRIDANGVLTPLGSALPDSSTYLVYGPITPDGPSGSAVSGLQVTQVDAVVVREIVGSSDGSAGQTFALSQSPLIAGSLQVFVDEAGTVPVPEWTQVDSLLESAPTDTDYVVRYDENDVAWIQFGDGVYGRVPLPGRNNLTASYLVGGGAKGNVAANTISKIVAAPPATGPQLALVSNLNAATGGADAESSADAVLRGPGQFRSNGRAVTASDYEQQAMTFGVAKVVAKASAWNVVQLYVAPAGGGYPSLTLKRDLLAYFDDKRILTTQVQVNPPVYVDITICGQLTVLPQYFADQVLDSAIQAVLAEWSFDQVDFGGTLFLSKAYELIQEVPGVESVNITTFNRADNVAAAKIPPTGAILLADVELPSVKTFVLTPSGGLSNG